MINRFTEKQIMVLKSLARYKFLTYSQMVRLGIDNHRSNLSNVLSNLRERKLPFVRKIPHRFGIEAKHYLTPKGRDLLMDLYDMEEEEIHCPKSVITTDTQDQKHRTSIIDIQIEMDLAAQAKGLRTLLVERYFDTTGNNRLARNLKSKTAIIYEGRKTIKADLNFILQTPTQKELYLLELENGKDTKKAVQKCFNHAKAILLGSANKKYHLQQGYRTLWVFEHASILEATLRNLSDSAFFKNLTEYFLFKPLEEIGDSFFEGWSNLDGKERKMYY